MNKLIKRGLVGILGLATCFAAGVGIYVISKCAAFDASMNKVYDVPLPKVVRSTDPAVLARGRHLDAAIATCSAHECHGSDLAGGATITMGPLGSFTAPNITAAGLGAAYTDAELARLIKHGIKKDGRSVRLMIVEDFRLPDSDVEALVSYVRTLPPVEKPNGPINISLMGKVLDQRDLVPLDVARRVDHERNAQPLAEPTAEYGRYVSEMCRACHGKQLSGGRIPGLPSEFPVPLNLTPHESGLKDWTIADFERLIRTGVRKSGKALHPFMPIKAYKNMDDVELLALWTYLRTVPPVEFGNR